MKRYGPYVCPKCGFMFASVRGLKEHEKHPHAQDILRGGATPQPQGANE